MFDITDINAEIDKIICLRKGYSIDHILKRNHKLNLVCGKYFQRSKKKATVFNGVASLLGSNYMRANGKSTHIYFPLKANWIIMRTFAESRPVKRVCLPRLTKELLSQSVNLPSLVCNSDSIKYLKYSGDAREASGDWVEESHLFFAILHPHLKRAQKLYATYSGEHQNNPDSFSRVMQAFHYSSTKNDITHYNHWHLREKQGPFQPRKHTRTYSAKKKKTRYQVMNFKRGFRSGKNKK